METSSLVTIILIQVILQGSCMYFLNQIQVGECITNTWMIGGHGIESESGCPIGVIKRLPLFSRPLFFRPLQIWPMVLPGLLPTRARDYRPNTIIISFWPIFMEHQH
jgi:hypothetical protein